jgi:hypothetical protein
MTRADIVAERLPNFEAIVANVPFPDALDDATRRRITADVLAAAQEYAGARLPTRPFRLNDRLTVKAFPQGVPALTTKGLAEFYARRGWEYMVLRTGPLVRALLGQNERLQEILALYEAQCEAEGVSALPPFADGPNVAGGTEASSPFATMLAALEPDQT